MLQHKRLINGEEYQPAGGGSHRGYDLRCERIEYFPYRISVLHLLPRYAPRTENPPGAAGGYRFSRAMANPGFIGIEAIRDTYLPMGFTQFKIEGRGLGSALILEFLLHYLTKPEYQLAVREELYLDNMLDLF